MSDSQRRWYEEGIAQGRIEAETRGVAKGMAKVVTKVLAHRALVVTEAQQRQIVECLDIAVLDRWLDRVLTVASVDELLG
jgi:hypothetical protein